MRRRARFDCMTKATYRQVQFALKLLAQAGQSTPSLIEIKRMSVVECAKFIKTLNAKAGEK